MNTAQNPGPGIWVAEIWTLLFTPTFQAVLGVLILLAVCWFAIYVMARLRDSNNQDVPLHDLVQKNFEEMRTGGDISDVEFRKITSLLAEKPRRPSLPMANPTSGSHDEDSDEKSR